jgi:hypothetical protein
MKLVCIIIVLFLFKSLVIKSKRLYKKHLNRNKLTSKLKNNGFLIDQPLIKCKNVGYNKNGTLNASCIVDEKQEYYTSSIDINEYIGNQNGNFKINEKNFTKTCRNIRLEKLQPNGEFFNEYRLKGQCLTFNCKQVCKKILFFMGTCENKCEKELWLNSDIRLDLFFMSKQGKLAKISD